MTLRSLERKVQMETLREISSNYMDLLYEVIQVEEIPDEVFTKLKCTNEKFDEKIENIAYIIEELKTKCAIVNKEIDRLTERLVRWNKNIKALQEYVKNEMVYIGKDKIETPIYTIKVRKSEQTEIDDEFVEEAKEKNLSNLIRVVPEKIEPDKKAIKDYINSGHELNHARIIEKQNLSIR